MKTTTFETKLTKNILASWKRVRSTNELKSLIARRELALSRVMVDDDF